MTAASARSWLEPERTGAAPRAPPAGIHIPFTSPALAGVRTRRSGSALEYMLLNPSGGRGSYVLSWSMMSELTAPTLHDALVARRLENAPRLPASALAAWTVRRAARAVAADGYLGREAAEVARQAMADTENAERRVAAHLLDALARCAAHATAPPSPVAHERLARDGAGASSIFDMQELDTLALRAGWAPEPLSQAVREIAEAYAAHAGELLPETKGGTTRTGRTSRLLRLLHWLQESLRTVASVEPGRALAQRLLQSLTSRLDAAGTLRDAVGAHLADPLHLLDMWRVDPADALRPAATLEACLDGWERIALLWQLAPNDAERGRLVSELTVLARAADLNAAGCAPAKFPAQAGAALRRHPLELHLPLIHRNETLRLLELRLEAH